MKRYRVIDHTADMGIRVVGKDLKELFENAGIALFDLLTPIRTIQGKETMDLKVEGEDLTDLMVNWLRELLFLWTGREFLVRGIEVQEIRSTQVRALVRGEEYCPERHAVRTEIKAVTYHQARVFPLNRGWSAQIIFDV